MWLIINKAKANLEQFIRWQRHIPLAKWWKQIRWVWEHHHILDANKDSNLKAIHWSKQTEPTKIKACHEESIWRNPGEAIDSAYLDLIEHVGWSRWGLRHGVENQVVCHRGNQLCFNSKKRSLPTRSGRSSSEAFLRWFKTWWRKRYWIVQLESVSRSDCTEYWWLAHGVYCRNQKP